MIEVNENKVGTKVIGFPKLMVDTYNTVVLMSGYNSSDLEGVVIKGSDEYDVGYHSDAWVPKCFTDYVDEITLKNVR